MSRTQTAPAASAPTSPPYLSRDRAAAWFAAQGFEHVTANQLRRLASEDTGPTYCRLGRFVYYAEADLAAWLRDTLRPATEGRTRPATLG